MKNEELNIRKYDFATSDISLEKDFINIEGERILYDHIQTIDLQIHFSNIFLAKNEKKITINNQIVISIKRPLLVTEKHTKIFREAEVIILQLIKKALKTSKVTLIPQYSRGIIIVAWSLLFFCGSAVLLLLIAPFFIDLHVPGPGGIMGGISGFFIAVSAAIISIKQQRLPFQLTEQNMNKEIRSFILN